ncbi:probable serine hydrolase [Onthophagus taurus]|uniref:probable serine hydrolase n=1 Tax=Onthophagus taurus TaxID=166361 RepID=UPI000C207B95|nr:probable serine hydrolase [Onthophagus taurus]
MTQPINGVNGCNGVNGKSESLDYEEIEIPVPWGIISGKWWGSKEQQPFLALHGWQDNANTFDNLAPLLIQEGHSILAIDLPGHGRSSHYPQGTYYYIFWDGIHLIRRIVKHFKWEKIDLLGHSLGGIMSFLYASVYPEEVGKYISIDIAGPVTKSEKTHQILGGSVDKFLEFDNLDEEKTPTYTYQEAFDIYKKAYEKNANEESCRILLERGLKKNEDGSYSFARDLRLKVCALGFFTVDQVMGFAQCVKCDVLNIRGNPGMDFPPERYDAVLDEIEKTCGRLVRKVVPGKHHLHLDNAKDVANVIIEFLQDY